VSCRCLSREPSGRDRALPPPGEGALNEQDPFAAAGSVDTCVDLIRNGAGVPADEGDHELVGTHRDGHAPSFVAHCASLRP
jgi:hypothetical protein